MADDYEFGLRLPSFTREDTRDFEGIVDYVERASDDGFSHFWFIYHLTTTKPAYATSWLDPITLMSGLASRVDDATFGPMILPTPLEHPLHIAKKFATFDHLYDGRTVLGLGSGWNDEEFDTIGIPRRERGRRTTETIRMLRRLWSEDNVSFAGDFFELDDITIDPKPVDDDIPIWIGGGTQAFPQLYGEPIPDTIWKVLKRTAHFADGWIPHATATHEQVADDYHRILEYCDELGRDPDDIDIVYENFAYVYDSEDREAEHERAHKGYKRFSGMDPDHIDQFYLVGTPEEIIEKMERRIEATDGVDHIVINPTSFDDRQYELINDAVLDHFR